VITIQEIRKQAESLVQERNNEAADLSYKQALEGAIEINDAQLFSTIGRSGSIYEGIYGLKDIVKLVMEACERAVQLEPSKPAYHDTRALARALTGNYTGAIEDLEKSMEDPAYRNPATSTGQLQKHENWIKILRDEKKIPLTKQYSKVLLDR